MSRVRVNKVKLILIILITINKLCRGHQWLLFLAGSRGHRHHHYPWIRGHLLWWLLDLLPLLLVSSGGGFSVHLLTPMTHSEWTTGQGRGLTECISHSQVFDRAMVFFSIGGQTYSPEPVRFNYMRDPNMEHARDVTIKLHHRIGRYVKVHLFFAMKWILLSEVSFVSSK